MTGKDEQRKPSSLKFWPNGRSQPITFVHVMGCEQSLAVSGQEGSEQSKSNAKEVEVAVSVLIGVCTILFDKGNVLRESF